jgi:hypothetical protein
MIVSEPAALSVDTSARPLREITFKAGAELLAGFGSHRTIAAGTKWRYAGALPQGDVYRPVATVFTIQSRHAHEAYLVIKDRLLVGFYLPGEARFSPIAQSLQLDLGESQ